VYKHFQVIIKTSILAVLLFSLLLSQSATAALDPALEEHYDLKLLGKYVFFDKISEPTRMACVTCHDPETGGTGSVSGVNLHQVAITGANSHTVGNLKPPTNAYATRIGPFQTCGNGGLGSDNHCGGNFWNGRAEGNEVALFPGATKHVGTEVFQGAPAGDPILEYAAYFGPTADQAINPMPNIVEQNIQRQAVCEHVASSKYAELYELAWGEPINCSSELVTIKAGDVASETKFDISFKRLMLAVCAWQDSKDLNSFSSKRDIALRQELACIDGGVGGFAKYYDSAVCDAEDPSNWGKFPLVGLTDQENLGHDLFYNVRLPFGPPSPPPFPDLPVTQCAFCHSSDTTAPDGTGLFERYADDAYHNIGTPANPELPDLYLEDLSLQPPPDEGIATHSSGLITRPGFWKTPTLRNVDKRKEKDFIKAYAHNGWFKSMESIVHFYNTSFFGGFAPGRGLVPYEATTAASFGIVRCAEDVVGHSGPYTEKEALANNCWPEAEFPGAAVGFLVGDLGMNAEQEAALVAYLKTLTDTETPKAPKPYKSAKM
jgi:cytochrome c peroxidase